VEELWLPDPTEEHKPLHSSSTPPGSEEGCTDCRRAFQSLGIGKEQQRQQQQGVKAQAEKSGNCSEFK